jgi:glycosyltransferase involved in cell wall biosynthesis
MLVSAIVPLYNSERFLAQSLNSALTQTWRNLEIVIVDDGSTDGSAAIADSYARSYPDMIRVIHQRNEGVCHARNTAMAAAHGDCFALLDADDIWLPHHLEVCVAELQRRPEAALVHADVERIDTDGNSLGRSPRMWDRIHGDTFRVLYLRREHVCCSTTVFRREAIDSIGHFDVQFNRLGCEDRDLWLRMTGVAPFVYIDDVHTRYRMHGDNMSANFSKMMQARIRLVDKHTATVRGRPLRRRALAAAHCNLGDELVDAAQRGAALRAYAHAFGLWPVQQKALRGMLRCLVKRQLPRRQKGAQAQLGGEYPAVSRQPDQAG